LLEARPPERGVKEVRALARLGMDAAVGMAMYTEGLC